MKWDTAIQEKTTQRKSISLGNRRLLISLNQPAILERTDNRAVREAILILSQSEARKRGIGKSTLHYLRKKANNKDPFKLYKRIITNLQAPISRRPLLPIPGSQLETWSNQGPVVTSNAAYTSIRTALSSEDLAVRAKYVIYLQGSYRNVTNIYSETDVDVVIQLNSTIRYDVSLLPNEERNAYDADLGQVTYTLQNFRTDVLRTLRSYL